MCEEIEPAYDFQLDKPTKLREKLSATLSLGKSIFEGTCDVVLEYFPHTGVYLHITIENVAPPNELMIFYGGDDLKLSVNGVDIDGFITGRPTAVNECVNLTWCPKSVSVKLSPQGDEKIQYGVFHLFNFTKFVSETTLTRETDTYTQFAPMVELIDDDWKIVLLGSKPIQKEAQNLSYKLTHTGKLVNRNGHFSPKDYGEQIICLRYALSFATGSWTEIVCPVGFDSHNERVWENWSSPHNKNGKEYYWLDTDEIQNLAKFYPCFTRFWKDLDWQDTLREVIYWYLESNNEQTNPDVGIILTQTALERLAYHYVVRYKKLLSRKGFKDLWASDKFRLLFSSLNIPNDIPSTVPTVKKFFSRVTNEKNNSAYALADIRNSLVHADKDTSYKGSDLYFETWKLGQWYLELAILAIVDYKGSYLNRLNKYRHPAEDLPWKK